MTLLLIAIAWLAGVSAAALGVAWLWPVAVLLAVKALFFFADTGYPDFNRLDDKQQTIPPYCDTGANCVYARYVAAGRGPALEAAGVTDVGSFTGLYWEQQLATAGLLLGLSIGSAALGGIVYGLTRPKSELASAPTPVGGS